MDKKIIASYAFAMQRRSVARKSDAADYQATVNRAYEARYHKTVAQQVAVDETIMRQIEREQNLHVCHVFENDSGWDR